MKTLVITFVSGLVVLASCSNNQKTVEVKTDTLMAIPVDNVKQLKPVAVQTEKKKPSEEDRDMNIMKNILKKKKKIQ
ncbi:hypothetical protein EON73_01245 [bacterium]|nr:MAG: hypothetical protein EON73_01245 [bacterium]